MKNWNVHNCNYNCIYLKFQLIIPYFHLWIVVSSDSWETDDFCCPVALYLYQFVWQWICQWKSSSMRILCKWKWIEKLSVIDSSIKEYLVDFVIGNLNYFIPISSSMTVTINMSNNGVFPVWKRREVPLVTNLPSTFKRGTYVVFSICTADF